MNKLLPSSFTPYLLLVVTSLLLTGCFHKKETPQITTPIKTVATPTPAETPLSPEERPIITLKANKDLTKITFSIEKLPADVTTVDYEFNYLSEGLPRGFLGTYPVGKGEVTRELGSCSSGTCKFDKNITEGSLTIKYRTNGQRILLREPLTIN